MDENAPFSVKDFDSIVHVDKVLTQRELFKVYLRNQIALHDENEKKGNQKDFDNIVKEFGDEKYEHISEKLKHTIEFELNDFLKFEELNAAGEENDKVKDQFIEFLIEKCSDEAVVGIPPIEPLELVLHKIQENW